MSQNFTIKQGESLVKPFYWYDGDPVTVAITAVTLTYPPVFTTASHNLPTDEIPAILRTIRGPRQLNTPPHRSVYAKKLSSTTFTVTELNASGLVAYTGGGYLRYTPPKDITGYSARMQVRSTLPTTTTLLNLTSGASDLIIDPEGKITLIIDDSDTAALTFTHAVYDLELISDDLIPIVTRIASGKITLDKEVTR